MNRNLAKFISIILHPVLIPTYALFFIFGNTTFLSIATPGEIKKAIFYIVICNTLVFPVFIMLVLYKTRAIASFEMEKKEERRVPYISNLLLILIAAYLIHTLRLPTLFLRMLLGGAAAVFITLLVNFKWKISIHMVGIGGLTGLLFALTTLYSIDLRYPVIFSLLAAGILGTARISLAAHQHAQIYLGSLVGALCEYYFLGM